MLPFLFPSSVFYFTSSFPSYPFSYSFTPISYYAPHTSSLFPVFFSLFFLSFSYTQTFLSFFPRSSSCFKRFSFPFVVTSFSVLIVHLFPFSPLLPVSFLFLVSFPLIPNTSSPFPFLSHPYFFSVFFPPLSPTHVYSSSLFFHCSPSSFMHFSLCASSPSF